MKEYILTQDFKIPFSDIESLNTFLDKNIAFKDFKIIKETREKTAYTFDNRYYFIYNLIIPENSICLVEKVKTLLI